MRLQGLRDLINQLRREKEKQLKQYDLDSMMDDLKEKLDQIVDMERRGLEKRLEDARAGTEEGPVRGCRKCWSGWCSARRTRSTVFLKAPAACSKELMDYEFFDEEAAGRVPETVGHAAPEDARSLRLGTWRSG